jgi:2-aminobenzoate-CoA ligase
VGRIAARGPTGLTYWNRHQIQEAEVVDGWTITDDLARVDEDGFLWFLGRLNNLVVTAGYKVAPGEVEQALLQHPAVREVAVVGLPDALREQVVAAFVVPALGEGDERLAEELQAWCKERLAPYKYPRRVFFRASLPRDPVGKVQVRQLADSVGAG